MKRQCVLSLTHGGEGSQTAGQSGWPLKRHLACCSRLESRQPSTSPILKVDPPEMGAWVFSTCVLLGGWEIKGSLHCVAAAALAAEPLLRLWGGQYLSTA